MVAASGRVESESKANTINDATSAEDTTECCDWHVLQTLVSASLSASGSPSAMRCASEFVRECFFRKCFARPGLRRLFLVALRAGILLFELVRAQGWRHLAELPTQHRGRALGAPRTRAQVRLRSYAYIISCCKSLPSKPHQLRTIKDKKRKRSRMFSPGILVEKNF